MKGFNFFFEDSSSVQPNYAASLMPYSANRGGRFVDNVSPEVIESLPEEVLDQWCDHPSVYTDSSQDPNADPRPTFQ